jgi:virginiamycin B lyase
VVAAGGGSLWLANANYDLVTRVDAAEAKVVASIPVPVATPFAVAFFQGAAWAAGSGKVARIDPATNRVTGTLTLSPRSVPVFTQLASGDAGLWATDYDRGLLYRIHVP